MKFLFFDIETVPTPEALASIGAQDAQPEPDEQTIKRLSLSAVTAKVICIGYVIEPPRDAAPEVLYGEEGRILRDFWKLAADASLFVGHNILDFDLRFIYQRSMINQIKPSIDIPFTRYRNSAVFDTMHEWTKWGRDLIKLELLAKALNIPSPKADIDGSKIYPYFKIGRHSEIYAYCKGDVETVRKVYHRMTFSD